MSKELGDGVYKNTLINKSCIKNLDGISLPQPYSLEGKTCDINNHTDAYIGLPLINGKRRKCSQANMPLQHNERANKRCKDLGSYKHFIVNSRKITEISDIHSVLKEQIGMRDFKINRIRKPLSWYTRISVKNEVKNFIRDYAFMKCKSKLDLDLKRQSLKRNLALEEKSRLCKSNSMRILSLNINGLQNKMEELYTLLSCYSPEIVVLQETKRRGFDKKIFINRYTVVEVPADDGSLGLLVAVKSGLAIYPRVIIKEKGILAVELRGNNLDLTVANIYMSHNSILRTETEDKLFQLFQKHGNNKNLVVVGDWNTTPDKAILKLSRKGCKAYASNAPNRGTRIDARRIITKHCIDFAVANNIDLVIRQHVKRKWRLSDHLPVEITLNLECRISASKRLTIDRNLLKTPKIASALKAADYGIGNENILSDVTSFHEKLRDKLLELKVLKEETSLMNKDPYIPIYVKKAIQHKRMIDIQVTRGLANMEQLLQARSFLKKQLVIAKRKAYNRFIKKGVQFLSNNDSKNSWKWIKRHFNLSKKGTVDNAIYKSVDKDVETNPQAVLEIWSNHFRDLSKRADEEQAIVLAEGPRKYGSLTD
ncbi:MAG: endonuclease/exonuclease/phosphatase family protein, partial [Bacteroidales bacterium]